MATPGARAIDLENYEAEVRCCTRAELSLGQISDTTKRFLQMNFVMAKVWAIAAACFAVPTLFLLSKTKRFHLMSSNKPTVATVLLYCCLCSFFALFHTALILFTHRLRRHKWVRDSTPLPMVIAFGCVISIITPLACTFDNSTDSSYLNHLSIITVALMCVQFFCVHMSLLVAFDYMFVHLVVGFLLSILTTLCVAKILNRHWFPVGVIASFLFLTVHHWATSNTELKDHGIEVFNLMPNGQLERDTHINPPEARYQPCILARNCILMLVFVGVTVGLAFLLNAK